MRTHWLLSLFVLFMTCCICSCSSSRVHQTEQALIQMELNRSTAIAAHDTITLNGMYTDDFKGVTAIGFEVNKSLLMQVFKRDNPATIFSNTDQKVRLINKKTAILTGKLTGKEATSGKIMHQSVYVHVLVKNKHGWQIVQGQGTMIPER